jgi:prepilin-type N-terminal cleavage/methylation domain-containing protein
MKSDFQEEARRAAPSAEHGFSLIELMVVCVVLAIISAIAIPNIVQMNANYKLDAAGHSVASLLQQARMQAVKTNQPAYAISTPGSSTAFINTDLGNSYTSGEPDVAFNGIFFQAPAASLHQQLDAYVGATAGSPAQVGGDIGFNARGLPCVPNAATPAVCLSSTSGFEWFIQDSRGGWEAITVTPAGRIKSWRLSLQSGGTNVCGYSACWL